MNIILSFIVKDSEHVFEDRLTADTKERKTENVYFNIQLSKL